MGQDTKSTLVSPAFGFEMWKADLALRGLSPRTIELYSRHVRPLLEAYATPNEAEIKAFLAKRLQGVDAKDGDALERRKTTLRLSIEALRSFFGYLHSNRLWNQNPAARLRTPKLARRERKCPRLEDVRKLLALDLSTHDRLFLALLLDTGMRLGELATITKDKIDLSKRCIVIMGKGAKERVVPISPSTVELVQWQIGSIGDSRYLFPVRSKLEWTLTAHECDRNFERRLVYLCKRAGIERICPHQLRHFVATYLLERGADIKAVSGLLGHADVVITLQTYHHVGRRNIEEMHKRLGVFANRPQVPQIEARTGQVVDGEAIEHKEDEHERRCTGKRTSDRGR